MSGLALFDLDGTLTRKDTFVEFLRFDLGRTRANLLLVASLPLLILARLRVMRDDAPKRFVLRHAFFERNATGIREKAAKFHRERMSAMMRRGAIERIRWHQQRGDRVVIVTASCSLWIGPWSEAMGVELIATELQVRDDGTIGELATPNCKGAEKPRRIRGVLDPSSFATIDAYGDTTADGPMLAMATHAHWRPFR